MSQEQEKIEPQTEQKPVEVQETKEAQQAPEVPSEDGPKMSKNQLKKLEREKAKQAEIEKKYGKKAEKTQQEAQEAQQKEDNSKHLYGELEMIQSQSQTNRVWTKVININETQANQEILVRARLHSSRVKGKLAFLVLREQFSTVQVVASQNEVISKQMIKFIEKIPSESIVDITATVVIPKQEIKSCTQKVELELKTIFIVSRSASNLPFQLEDASRRDLEEETEYDEDKQGEQQTLKEEPQGKEEQKKQQVKVLMKTRLDNRVIDLRTTTKQAIFRIQSGVCQLFRDFLLTQDFIEIHSPKLIGGTSEGGCNVFKLKYFDKEACLAQSPQFYKQMAIMADFDRVFEIGPVFRAENSFTHRHMCEFTGLDMEMAIKENYHEVLDMLGDMFIHIFDGLTTKFAKELQAIQDQFPFEPFVYKKPALKLTFEQGVELLKKEGIEIDPYGDLSTEIERKLGAIVKREYGTDFYMLHRYPLAVRPFYTMPCKDDPKYSNSYDFFMRGEEITSGAQRLHDPKYLAVRAKECQIDVSTIQDYINSFAFGAFPHGGCGIGLERVIFLYCNLKNIRNSSLFPRDPKRIVP